LIRGELMKFEFSINNNNKGSALAFVIVILMVISLLSLSMAQVFSSNLKQTKHLQDSLEAYYLSYSGALIGYEALLANSNDKLDDLTNGSSIAPSTIILDNGNAIVSAEVSTDTNFEDWIKITSIATINRTGLSYTRVMYFDPMDPLDVLWRNN
jgi:hypothetical protein